MDLALRYTYQECVETSERVAWKLDDVFPVGTRLDFNRPFLPEALAPTQSLAFLSKEEKRTLNQIAGNAYLNLFAFVEEYILATVLKHSAAEVFGDHVAIRALSRFADEEVKHQQLFGRYRQSFDRDFGHPAEVLASAVEVAGVVLSKSPLAVLMLTLHIEFMTQQHYTECVKDNGDVDPLFAKLLKQHWLEESQHAKIDALEMQKLLVGASAEQIKKGFEEYLELGGAVAGLLAQQAGMDVTSLEKRLKKTFSEEQRAAIKAQQIKGYNKTFLHYGMTNPTVVDIMTRMDADMAGKVAQAAAGLA